MAPVPAGPTVALALGGGGARGLAHVAMLEALDELGVRPVAMAGSSMGAIFAAAYASGLSAAEIREHTVRLLADRRGLRGKLLSARSGRLSDLFSHMGNPVMIDAEAFCDAFLPGAVAQDFAHCVIPLTVVATDFHARRERVFTAGPLRPAVAASMAIPGLVRPVIFGDAVLIDGAATNPLPVDHLAGTADIVVGIDVTGSAPVPREDGALGAWAALFGALQIMQAAIIEEKLARHPPDILIRPNVGAFGALDFALSSAIFRLTRPAKEELKRRLAALLDRTS